MGNVSEAAIKQGGERVLMERPDPFIGVRTPPGARRVKMLGVYYIHRRTSDGGDLYVTKCGLPFYEHLKLRNWREEAWFRSQREALEGTSTVYRVPSKMVGNRSISLVVKWSRVGEEVPLDTMTFDRFSEAEFNTPFEEFSLLIEMRERRAGPPILTNRPLAIYVPPERLKLWQTGRTRSAIARKKAKQRDVELDILRQYILVYEWVKGEAADDLLARRIPDEAERRAELWRLTERASRDMEQNGFFVVDHKPAHVILREREDGSLLRNRRGDCAYALVDFELLSRTPEHEQRVEHAKRERYLQHQRMRLDLPTLSPVPDHLARAALMDVDYIWGHAGSTRGRLWVVGRDPELFDYFLPERWRHTRRVKMSRTAVTYHTISKDHVKLVWKVSRVGEAAPVSTDRTRSGFNSPFEEFAIAMELHRLGFSVVYPRAIYMSGLECPEAEALVADGSRFASHEGVQDPEGHPVLSPEHSYITIWGFWQGRIGGPDAESLPPCTGVDLVQAVREGLIGEDVRGSMMAGMTERLHRAGYRAELKPTHLLLSRARDGSLLSADDETATITICNFERLYRAV